MTWLLPRSIVPPLPTPTRRFLRTEPGRRVRAIVLDLHRWLIFRRFTLGELTPARVARFLKQPSRTEIAATTRRVLAKQLKVYLCWLWRHRLIAFDPTPRRRREAHPLPPLAHAFLASLRPTLRPSTCDTHAGSLRKLYAWLDRHGLELTRLTRRRFAAWLLHLHSLGLAPATRLGLLFNVRAYLRWVAERRRLRTHPDDLVRRTDLPKLPTYLPRPLPPDIDRELQRRLAQAEDLYAPGLLLMRRTGLRVGELLRLDYECLRTDAQDRWYLKVPLGKLYTERLVPLDEDTVALVRQLRTCAAPSPRPLLMPTPSATEGSYQRCRKLLRAVSADLHDAAPITTHRLRHTYATELLNAGMSLVGVMRLLGHRDYRMTLRYAAITHETVGKEYYQALERLTDKYRLPAAPAPDLPADPRSMLEDIARWARRHASAADRLHALLNRIARLKRDLDEIGPSSPT